MKFYRLRYRKNTIPCYARRLVIGRETWQCDVQLGDGANAEAEALKQSRN